MNRNRISLFVAMLSMCLFALATSINEPSDRGMLYLRGPVKTANFPIKWGGSFQTGHYKFSEKGEWQRLINATKYEDTEIIHDVSGRITRITSRKEECNWRYDNDGKPILFSINDDYGRRIYRLFYNKEGQIETEMIEGIVADSGEHLFSEINYTVLAQDQYGNWIRRKAVANDGKKTNEYIETCDLTYYAEEINEVLLQDIINTIKVTEQLKIVEDLPDEEILTAEEQAQLENRKNRTEYESNKIYDVVEVMPEYPGGIRAMLTYIARTLRYPTMAVENNIQGQVKIRFCIEKDGSISSAQAIQKVSPELDAEAIRVVNSFPKWKPGLVNGSPARVYYTVPVNFKLQ